MKAGFLKAAALSPSLRVADCNYNASQIVSQLQDAAARGVRLAVFPEFCLTGYTCGDLFLQRTLQQGALDALQTVLDASRELDVVALVGLPLLVRGKLYNCAAVLCRGRLLGLVPKTYLPNYGEFYEKRQFTPGSTEVRLPSIPMPVSISWVILVASTNGTFSPLRYRRSSRNPCCTRTRRAGFRSLLPWRRSSGTGARTPTSAHLRRPGR